MSEAGERCLSSDEMDWACLAAGAEHDVKEELVLSPEHLQPTPITSAVPSLCSQADDTVKLEPVDLASVDTETSLQRSAENRSTSDVTECNKSEVKEELESDGWLQSLAGLYAERDEQTTGSEQPFEADVIKTELNEEKTDVLNEVSTLCAEASGSIEVSSVQKYPQVPGTEHIKMPSPIVSKPVKSSSVVPNQNYKLPDNKTFPEDTTHTTPELPDSVTAKFAFRFPPSRFAKKHNSDCVVAKEMPHSIANNTILNMKKRDAVGYSYNPPSPAVFKHNVSHMVTANKITQPLVGNNIKSQLPNILPTNSKPHIIYRTSNPEVTKNRIKLSVYKHNSLPNVVENRVSKSMSVKIIIPPEGTPTQPLAVVNHRQPSVGSLARFSNISKPPEVTKNVPSETNRSLSVASLPASRPVVVTSMGQEIPQPLVVKNNILRPLVVNNVRSQPSMVNNTSKTFAVSKNVIPAPPPGYFTHLSVSKTRECMVYKNIPMPVATNNILSSAGNQSRPPEVSKQFPKPSALKNILEKIKLKKRQESSQRDVTKHGLDALVFTQKPSVTGQPLAATRALQPLINDQPLATIRAPQPMVNDQPLATIRAPQPMVNDQPLATIRAPQPMVNDQPLATTRAPQPMLNDQPLATTRAPQPMLNDHPLATIRAPQPMLSDQPLATTRAPQPMLNDQPLATTRAPQPMLNDQPLATTIAPQTMVKCTPNLKLEDFLKPCIVKLERIKLLTCSACRKQFQHKSDFVKHVFKHVKSNRRVPCRICKKLVSCDRLKAHERAIHGPRLFWCDDCGKKFAEKSALVDHVRIHTGQKPFRCKICKTSYRTRSNLVSHNVMHKDFKPHVCNICDKEFQRRTSLKKHLRIHLGVRPYKCLICEKLFYQRYDLDSHIVVVHTRERPYGCEICKERFALSWHRNKHMRDVHAKQKNKTNNNNKKARNKMTRKDHLQKSKTNKIRRKVD